MTEWAPICGFEGRYEASDQGEVRSCASGMLLAQQIDKYGYPRICLGRRPNRKTIRTHVVVLTAFCGERGAGQQGRHLNGRRTDCRLENLSWGSHEENHADRVMHGKLLKGSEVGNAKLSEVQAKAILSASGTLRDIATKHGVSRSLVSLIKLGKRWTHLKERDAGAVNLPA